MKYKKAFVALSILAFVTTLIAGYEFMNACNNFAPTGNIFDFCAGAVTYVPYTLIFLLVLFIALPFALLLYKEAGISLKEIIYEKKHLCGDIFLGISLGIVSAGLAYPFSLMRDFGSNFKHNAPFDKSIWLYIMIFLSLTLVCSFLKELYFRGFALHFLSEPFGENGAILITSILFCIVDWQNMGSSLILGLLWGFVYFKKRRLIIPMIAHGMINFISLIWLLVV